MHSNRKGDVMLKYVLKRLGYILVTLWVIVTCTFFMMKNLPGTPFDAERFSIMTPQQQERVLEMYGLNDSLPMQYVKYIKNMLKGDLGTSFTYVNQDVSKVITGRTICADWYPGSTDRTCNRINFRNPGCLEAQ